MDFVILVLTLVVVLITGALSTLLLSTNPDVQYEARKWYTPLALVLDKWAGGPSQITPANLTQWLGLSKESVVHCEEASETLHGGFVGALSRVKLTYNVAETTYPTSVVVKSSRPGIPSISTALLLKSHREAQFYQHFQHSFPIRIPKLFHASWTQFSKRPTIVMEDLQHVIPVAHFLDFASMGHAAELPEDAPSPEHVMNLVLKSLAKLHGKYCDDPKLLEMDWLKGVSQRKGEDRCRFEMSRKLMRERWEVIKVAMTKKFINGRDYQVNWSPRLVQFIDECFTRTTWKAVSGARQHFTLLHGDFHTGNLLYKQKEDTVAVVDWPEAGVGEVGADLAQLLITNILASKRREEEMGWLKTYHSLLVSEGAQVSFQDCLQGYRRSGMGWAQSLILIASLSIHSSKVVPDIAIQMYHDQLAAFVEDHAEHVPDCLFTTEYCMPRDLGVFFPA